MASGNSQLEAYRERVTSFHLAAIVQNLKTLILRLIRPPAKARLRVSCVAGLVGGVLHQADVRIGQDREET